MTGQDAPSVVNALKRALTAAKPAPQDVGTVALAKHYAAAIEEAAALADEAALIEPETEDQAKRLAALSRRVEAQTVLGELGPKLLAALVELGMTPKARSAVAGSKGGGQGDGGKRSALDRLRDDELARQRARKHGAADLDSSSS
jgi:hypothetical protein